MQNEVRYMQEDTIDLKELFIILKKRKKIIVAVTISISILAIVYAFFIAHPQYEAKATIQIGKQLIKRSDGSIEVKYFEEAKVLKQTLDVKYDTVGKYRDHNVTAYIDNISVPKKTNQFLTITAMARSNADAIAVLKHPIEDILHKHRIYKQSIIDVKQNRLHSLQAQLDHIKLVQIPLMTQKIDRTKNDIKQKTVSLQRLEHEFKTIRKNDAALASITAMQIAALQRETINLKLKILDFKQQLKSLQEVKIPNLKAGINELRAAMQEPYVVPTKLIGKIYTHDKPVKPKKALILIVALLTGLMLGIFLAFFLEFLANAKNEKELKN